MHYCGPNAIPSAVSAGILKAPIRISCVFASYRINHRTLNTEIRSYLPANEREASKIGEYSAQGNTKY